MSQKLQLLPLKPLGPDDFQLENSIKAPLELDADEIKRAFQLTKASYKRTRTAAFEPFPIPAQDCIPTMASSEQTELYEAQLTGVLCGYLDGRTIADLLKIYSFSDKQIPIGKISFLGSFFQKIIAKNISLDVVILCKDIESQNHLLSILQAINLNCDHLTTYISKRDIFGVIVKIRKADKPRTPIKQATAVDLVLVYDSAVAVPNRVLNEFKGIDYDKPLIAHITTIDSADIRCYNNATTHKQYNWGTKYKNIPNAQEIFHQSNRHAERQHFFAWNDYVASEVADWVALKQNIPYRFYRPGKNHPAVKGYRSWGGGHPLNSTPSKPITPPATPAVTKAPKAPKAPKAKAATASSAALNTPDDNAGNSGAATKSKKKQKMKEEVQQQPAASSSSSPNVSHLPSVATTSVVGTGPLSQSSSPMQIDPQSSNVGNADLISQNLDYIPLLTNSQTQEPSIGDKRPSEEEDSTAEASTTTTTTKRARLDTSSSAPVSDFKSILDDALQEFEKQMNSLNTMF